MRLPGSQGVHPRRRRQEPGLSPPNRPDPTSSKRRMDEEDGGPALKLFLSEDIVSARLQRLSLDNDHNYGSSGFPRTSSQTKPFIWETGSPDNDQKVTELVEEESVLVDPEEFCMSNCKVLSVCPLLEESLRDHRPGTILPERLLHSLSSPCMELVLWSPPTSHIQQLIRSLAGLPDPPLKKLSSSTNLPKEQEDHMEL
ncbi:host cell factor C1 regulator 1 [Rhinophrynus dorsalis]